MYLSRSLWSCKNCYVHLRNSTSISSTIFAWSSKLMVDTVIVWYLDYSLSEADFWISFQESYHTSSNFTECRYFTTFEWLYFGSARSYSQIVGHAGSSIGIVHADMTLIRSMNLKPCMLAAMTITPLRGFLVTLNSLCMLWWFISFQTLCYVWCVSVCTSCTIT